MAPYIFVQSMFDCSEDEAQCILWERTAFPISSWSTTIKQLNDFWRRMKRGQTRFCDLCNREPEKRQFTCQHCIDALDKINNHP